MSVADKTAFISSLNKIKMCFERSPDAILALIVNGDERVHLLQQAIELANKFRLLCEDFNLCIETAMSQQGTDPCMDYIDFAELTTELSELWVLYRKHLALFRLQKNCRDRKDMALMDSDIEEATRQMSDLEKLTENLQYGDRLPEDQD